MRLVTPLGLAVISMCTSGCVLTPWQQIPHGFTLRSTDFGDPCTQDAGDFPVIYDNSSGHAVDISFKVVNTGGSNVFVVGTGYVIPPLGPKRRPRIIRLEVSADGHVKLRGQDANCAWKVEVRPHD